MISAPIDGEFLTACKIQEPLEPLEFLKIAVFCTKATRFQHFWEKVAFASSAALKQGPQSKAVGTHLLAKYGILYSNTFAVTLQDNVACTILHKATNL